VFHGDDDIENKQAYSSLWQRSRELGDFKGVSHFEAKFQVEGLRFAPMSMGR